MTLMQRANQIIKKMRKVDFNIKIVKKQIVQMQMKKMNLNNKRKKDQDQKQQ